MEPIWNSHNNNVDKSFWWVFIFIWINHAVYFHSAVDFCHLLVDLFLHFDPKSFLVSRLMMFWVHSAEAKHHLIPYGQELNKKTCFLLLFLCPLPGVASSKSPWQHDIPLLRERPFSLVSFCRKETNPTIHTKLFHFETNNQSFSFSRF